MTAAGAGLAAAWSQVGGVLIPILGFAVVVVIAAKYAIWRAKQ